MQHFHTDAFAALSPAKAKAHALALFDAAMIEPAADWRGVAFALHSVVSRKRGKVAAGEDTGDIADAGEFAAWADYAPTGKGTAIARGRVTVTFADGWSKTVGMLAGKTAKGRKPWSIAHAVRFAVICYKLAACRRATGSDAAMYFDRGGNASGESVTLDALIACPEIVSVVSADSAETVDGDLIWNPCEANAATLDLRAGAVAVPLSLAPMPHGIADALRAARDALLGRLGLIRSARFTLAKEAAARVEALLYPPETSGGDFVASDELFALVWDNPEDYPEAGSIPAPYATDAQDDGEAAAACLSPAALIEAAGEAIAMGEDVADVSDEPGPASEPAPADLETMTLASAIVKATTPVAALTMDDFHPVYSSLAFVDRFRLVEDALLAWPALADAMPADDAEPLASPLEPVEPAPAAMPSPIPQTPARKPRYRYSSLSGRWEPISEAAPALAA